MGDAPSQPKPRIEPALTDDRPSEPHASLNHDPSLLGIHRDRPAAASDAHPPTKRRTEDRRLAREMIRETVPTARMPEIAGDEAVATLRTTPEWA